MNKPASVAFRVCNISHTSTCNKSLISLSTNLKTVMKLIQITKASQTLATLLYVGWCLWVFVCVGICV